MFLSNESIGGTGYGGGGGYGHGDYGFGGGGILGMIALLSLFRGHFGEGRHEEANGCLCQMQSMLGDIRADIGDQKYDTVTNIMQSTSSLMQSICQGNYQNLQALTAVSNQLQGELFGISKEICAVDKDVLNAKFELSKEILVGNNITNQNILKQGFENQLGNERQTNILSRQLCDCCCETNQNIERTAFATQLRDLEYKCSTDKELEQIKCGQKAILGAITESRLLDENCRLKEKVEALRERDERNYLQGVICANSGKTDCLVNNLGSALYAQSLLTAPTTPFNWKMPNCGCCCGGY